MKPTTEEIVEKMRDCSTAEVVELMHGCAINDQSACWNCPFGVYSPCNAALLLAADARLEALEQELIDERYRHDRYADFCVAQGDELSRLKAQMRWIPVTERLPMDGKAVLTLDKRGHMRDRALYTFMDGKRLFRPDGLAPGYDVLYWMPLPEPPKEDKR